VARAARRFCSLVPSVLHPVPIGEAVELKIDVIIGLIETEHLTMKANMVP
jgi:hypothetical protein